MKYPRRYFCHNTNQLSQDRTTKSAVSTSFGVLLVSLETSKGSGDHLSWWIGTHTGLGPGLCSVSPWAYCLTLVGLDVQVCAAETDSSSLIQIASELSKLKSRKCLSRS